MDSSLISLVAFDIRRPADLAALSMAYFLSIAAALPEFLHLSNLRHVAFVTEMGRAPRVAYYDPARSDNAASMTAAFRQKNVEDATVACPHAFALSYLSPPDSFSSLCHADKVIPLSLAGHTFGWFVGPFPEYGISA